MAPLSTSSTIRRAEAPAPANPVVTAFVCTNCARPAQDPALSGHLRPSVPDFGWGFPVEQILVACTGRIQPEHVLKAFESGATLVCAVACGEGNCHYIEGSGRCARRIDYLRSVLDEVGLGSNRLMLFHLPGSAAQDTAAAARRHTPTVTAEIDTLVAAIRDEVTRALNELTPNPLYTGPKADVAEDHYQEVDASDDSEE
jgi:F420-non-reducing hydrogenase iron-sulfur subunit